MGNRISKIKKRKTLKFRRYKRFSKRKGLKNFMGPTLNAKYEIEYLVTVTFPMNSSLGSYTFPGGNTYVNILNDLLGNQDYLAQRGIYQMVKLTGIAAKFERSVVYTGWSVTAQGGGTTSIVNMPAGSFSVDLNRYVGPTANWRYLQRQYRVAFINEDSDPIGFYWRIPTTNPRNQNVGTTMNFIGSGVWSDSVEFGSTSLLYMNLGSSETPNMANSVAANTSIPLGTLRVVCYVKWCKNTGT